MSRVVMVYGSSLVGQLDTPEVRGAIRYWGALPGDSEGLFAHSYALPIKRTPDSNVLHLEHFKACVNTFLKCAADNPHLSFVVPPVGCGLDGFHATDIAPFFRDAPPNVFLSSALVDALLSKA